MTTLDPHYNELQLELICILGVQIRRFDLGELTVDQH